MIDTPLPGTNFRPSDIYPAVDHLVGRQTAGDFRVPGRRPDRGAPFGLMVFDLERAAVSLVYHGPTWCNMHAQYCRSTEPEASHDILIQENHGNVATASGSITRLVGGEGADIHVIRDDGTISAICPGDATATRPARGINAGADARPGPSPAPARANRPRPN